MNLMNMWYSFFIFLTSGLSFPDSDSVDVLKKTADRDFLWLLIATGLVAIGLLFEVGEVCQELKKWRKARGRKRSWVPIISAVGFLLVTIGVVGEGIFEGKLGSADTSIRKKDEGNIEELRARNLQLEEALSPRVIEQGRSAEELKKLKKVTFRIHTIHDIEPRRTAGQIMFLCSQGGWTYSKSFSSDRTAQFGEDFDGIFIEANVPSRGSDDLSWRAAKLLTQVLSEDKINSMVIARLLPAHPPFPDGAIMVHVGMKPIAPLFLEKGVDKSDSKFIMRGNVMTIPE